MSARQPESRRLADTLPVSESDDLGAPLEPTIERFVILGRLGAGGMGVVLSAYDPVLDRRVALKILRPGARLESEGERRALLQREAQAMARLSHPNVVTVHDVGAVGEQLFIAMEFVDGQTLRAWLDGDHDWREVVRLFGAAGSGLAAAHAAGLVHRDFKPENVLIGSDGRPRVVDFGLVGGVGEPGGACRPAVVGTPGYMSPEQLRGHASDAKSDQFSFCMALWEALDGAPPFAEREYRDAVLSGRVPPLPRRAPRWLGEAVLRGLRLAPDERWPDMGALQAALGRDPARSRRSALTAVAALAAAVGMVAAAHGFSARRADCGDGRERLRDVWDAPRRLAAERAFAATGLPFAGDTFARVAAALDHYTAAWATMHDEICRAPRVEPRPADSLRELRMACLEARRSTLAALTDEWAHGVDGEGLAGATTAAASLPSLDLCADTRTLAGQMPLPSDAAARARVEGARAALDRARALRAAGRMQAARTAAEAVRQRALADGYAPMAAEASLFYGSVLHAFGEPSAVAPLEEAARLAAQAGDDRLAADAAIELIGAMADSGQAPTAVATAPLVEALVVRAGDRPAQRGTFKMWQGSALGKAERNVEGVAALKEAHALLTQSLGRNDPLTLDADLRLYRAMWEITDARDRVVRGRELLEATLQTLGPDHPQTGVISGRLGYAAAQLPDFPTAHRFLERAVAIAERTYGAASLPAAAAINQRACAEESEDLLDAATRDYERVLAIRRTLLPPDHPLVAHALANLSIARRWQHRFAEAHAELSTALGIMRRTYGEDHSDVAYETALRGELYYYEGKLEASRDSQLQALVLWDRIHGPGSVNGAFSMLALARVDARLGRYAEARRLLAPTLEAFKRFYGPTHWVVAQTLAVRARCDLDEHGVANVAPLEAALHAIDRPGVPPSDLGIVRFELARAEWAAGDRVRARALAQKSAGEIAYGGPNSEPEMPRVRAWLAAHHP